MTSQLPVRIADSAARVIEAAATWWTTNRPKAPDAFVADLENALKLIASHPEIGAQSKTTRLQEVRRVHLARVHYHLYYRVTAEPAIEVLACGTRVAKYLSTFRTFSGWNTLPTLDNNSRKICRFRVFPFDLNSKDTTNYKQT